MFSKVIHNKIYYILFIALSFCIPFNRVSQFIIAFICLNWLLEARFIQKYIAVTKSLQRLDTILFAGLYLGYLAGLIYTSNMADGLFSLQVKLPLIIFPVLFATIDRDFWDRRKARILLISFIAGCLVATLYCLINAFITYFETKNIREFYYGDLSEFLHPSYYAMNLSFAIAVLIWLSLEKGMIKINWLKILVFLLIVYFSVFTIMLSSKAGVLVLLLIFCLTISYVIFVKRKYIMGIVLMVVTILLLALVLNVLPHSIKRFDGALSVIQNKENITNNQKDGTVQRILIWKYSLEIINRHFLFGVGTGDVRDTLQELYKEKNLNNTRARRLNTHNQYIQIFVTLGIIGFLLLVLSLLFPAIYSVRRKSFIYFCFLVIIGFNLLVEAMLERQAGLVFYAFFNAVLFTFFLDSKSVKQD